MSPSEKLPATLTAHAHLIQSALRAALCSLTGAVFIFSCGEPAVVAPAIHGEPAIVIGGYLFPGDKVRILITRSFPLNPTLRIDKFGLVIEDATVTLTDARASYPLTYNPTTLQYEFAGASPPLIGHGLTYHLDVSATLDGEALTAHTATTVPQAGFGVDDAASHLTPMRYRERDEDGEVKQFEIAFTRSPDVDFYLISLSALDASRETFVYDNPFVDHDSSDVDFFFNDLISGYEWSQNLPGDPRQEPVLSSQVIQWRQLLFYGRYRAILYAADRNFKEFFLTHSTLQEIDGNFHEPVFHIEGDGVGIFGSAIVDTVFFEVLE